MKGAGSVAAKKPVSTKHSWTLERLAALPTEKVSTLLAQAVKLNVPDLVAMCEDDLGQRAQVAAETKSKSSTKPSSGIVTEFHFVCANDRGVIVETDGTFRTGSWVVSEGLVKASLMHGTVVALHETRSAPSYRQGTLIGYSLTLRDMIQKDNFGVEFHVRPTPIALPWVGGGAGEKGYRWE